MKIFCKTLLNRFFFQIESARNPEVRRHDVVRLRGGQRRYRRQRQQRRRRLVLMSFQVFFNDALLTGPNLAFSITLQGKRP